jgi:hypothetical protein
MALFIIDEDQLQQLSPAARRELMSVLESDFRETRKYYDDSDWDPEGLDSYPLTIEEAKVLVNGMPEAACKALRVFVDNIDDDRGYANLAQLLDATGHSKVENINRQLAWILLRVRTATGNPDAWLVNWHMRDWIWSEDRQSYTDGKYFITEPALSALRGALIEDHS